MFRALKKKKLMNAFFHSRLIENMNFFTSQELCLTCLGHIYTTYNGVSRMKQKKNNIHIANPWNYASKTHCVSNPQPRHTGSTKDKCSYMNIRLLFFNAPAGAHRANRRLGRMGIYVHHKVFQKLLHKWLLTTVHSRLLHNNNL